ncbi:MAG: diguanylate cyclase, partial [Acidimicrobiia bacterium]|nr:diguanylate cyclase [Acidimicrobiia bacterium]
MGSKLRVTVDRRSRSALIVIPLIVTVATAAIFTLWDLKSQAHHASSAEALVGREVALTRDITQAAYGYGAGGASALMDLEAIAPEIDRVHYGLLYGDPALDFKGIDSPNLTRSLSDVEPFYLNMRSLLDDVVELSASPQTLVEAAEEYRTRLEVPAGLIQRASASTSNQLEKVALGALIGSFTIAITVFVLAPVVKRRREGDHNKRLRASGRPDHLTGLIRRQTLLDRIDDAVGVGARAGEHTAILVVDIDRMSRINNLYGRGAGDRILQDLASRLKNDLRAGDTVARLEDDQFGIIAPGIHRREDAAIVARKALGVLSRPFLDGKVTVTACVGIALAPTDTDSSERLLEDAAVAAVTAKQRGANNVLFYSRDLTSLARGRMHILDALREALTEGGQLRLAFQPKIDLREGKMSGVEALIRWTHPVRGELMPVDFIPLVEESELVLPLERWIIETACQQISAWRSLGLGDVAVSVNVSARQFRNGDLVDVVSGALDRASIKPQLLEIELTEGVLIENTDR